MQYVPLNLALIANPVNWVIIWLMITIAGLAVALVYHPSHTGVDV